jgi:hypothetical protein
MIALAAGWIAIMWVCLCLGSLCMAAAGAGAGFRRGDRLMLVLWLGLAVLCVLLLALSLVSPLTPWAGFAVLSAATAGAALVPAARGGLTNFFRALSAGHLLPVMVIMAVVAAVCSQVISNRDAMSYQFDIVTWLSQIGTVPGLALVNSRYGFISSWFALPAVFNHGFLTARVGTLANSFALLLLLLHLYTVAHRILTGCGRAPDFFLAFAAPSSIALPILLNYQLSPTPDFIVTVITVVVAWSMILLHQKEGGSLIPLILSAGAFTMKLIAAPLVLVSVFFYWHRKSWRFGSALVAILVTSTLVSPLLISAAMVSGHPLYPLPLRLDLPWSLEKDTAEKEAGVIVRARFVPRDGSAYLSIRWLQRWLRINKEHIAALLYLVLTVFALLWILLFQRRRAGKIAFVLGAGCCGLLFLVATSPQPRYGWGYLTVIPCSLAVVYSEELKAWFDGIVPVAGRFRGEVVVPLVLVILCTVPSSVWFSTRSETRLAKALQAGTIVVKNKYPTLLPPEIPNARYDDKRRIALPRTRFDISGEVLSDGSRGMAYSLKPSGNTCYRHPTLGSRGGYRRCDGG